MMQADVYFYPDARRRNHINVGSMLFGRAPQSEHAAFLISFHAAQPGSSIAASQTDSAVLRELMQDLGGFVHRHLLRIQFSIERDDDELTEEIATCLPENFRLGNATELPPEKYVDWLITHEGTKVHSIVRELSSV